MRRRPRCARSGSRSARPATSPCGRPTSPPCRSPATATPSAPRRPSPSSCRSCVRWQHRLTYYRAALARRQPVLAGLRCIHRYEGPWNAVSDSSPTYYGGLQMDRSFEQAYGDDVLAAHAGADAERLVAARPADGRHARLSQRRLHPVAEHGCGLRPALARPVAAPADADRRRRRIGACAASRPDERWGCGCGRPDRRGRVWRRRAFRRPRRVRGDVGTHVVVGSRCPPPLWGSGPRLSPRIRAAGPPRDRLGDPAPRRRRGRLPGAAGDRDPRVVEPRCGAVVDGAAAAAVAEPSRQPGRCRSPPSRVADGCHYSAAFTVPAGIGPGQIPDRGAPGGRPQHGQPAAALVHGARRAGRPGGARHGLGPARSAIRPPGTDRS